MRKVGKVEHVGARYDEAQGGSSVIPSERRRGARSPTGLSLGTALRLLRTPSSEAGIYEYYRTLLGRPPDPESLVAQMRALSVGRTMRFDVLASVANSEEARRNGVGGPGLMMINAAVIAARVSGLARRTRRRRFHAATMELLEREAARGPADAAVGRAGPPRGAVDADLARVLARGGEGVDPLSREQIAEVKERVAVLEKAMLEFLNARAAKLRRTGSR